MGRNNNTTAATTTTTTQNPILTLEVKPEVLKAYQSVIKAKPEDKFATMTKWPNSLVQDVFNYSATVETTEQNKLSHNAIADALDYRIRVTYSGDKLAALKTAITQYQTMINALPSDMIFEDAQNSKVIPDADKFLMDLEDGIEQIEEGCLYKFYALKGREERDLKKMNVPYEIIKTNFAVEWLEELNSDQCKQLADLMFSFAKDVQKKASDICYKYGAAHVQMPVTRTIAENKKGKAVQE